VGGAERFTNALAINLRAAGVDARVVCVCDPYPACSELVEAHVPLVVFGAQRGRQILRKPRMFATLVREAGQDVAVLQSAGFLPAAMRLGGYRGKLVAIEHGALPTTGRLLRLADRRSGMWALDAQVAVSNYIRERVLELSHAKRVERIYSGIDLSRFRSARADRAGQPFTVAFAGRLRPGKGAEHLLQAIALMRDRAAQLVIAGDGPQRTSLVRLSSELGLERRTHFLGLRHDMPTIWQGCDVCVVPSLEPEGAGMVALEAAACAKPVVASSAGGLPELVRHRSTGLVVPPGDVEALAAALDTYAADPELRARHGTAGRRRCEAEFDIRRCTQKYADLLSSLLLTG
jgi:glycosyltransferase involved in cell wall biosynthesis